LGLSRVKALHCFSPRELREVIVHTSGTSKKKGLNYSPRELSKVVLTNEKRELVEVLSTQPVQ
jgi:hypothetical protein